MDSVLKCITPNFNVSGFFAGNNHDSKALLAIYCLVGGTFSGVGGVTSDNGCRLLLVG